MHPKRAPKAQSRELPGKMVGPWKAPARSQQGLHQRKLTAAAGDTSPQVLGHKGKGLLLDTHVPETGRPGKQAPSRGSAGTAFANSLKLWYNSGFPEPLQHLQDTGNRPLTPARRTSSLALLRL